MFAALRPGRLSFAGALFVLVGLWLGSAPPASAQTLKDNLKQHTRESIDKKKKKKPEPEKKKPQPEKKPEPEEKPEPQKEPERQKKPEPDKPKPKPDVTIDLGEVLAGATAPPSGPKLPLRVIGDQLKIDIKLGAGYRGWYPQQYEAVDVDVGNYATWSIDVKAKIFKFLTLRRGYYEANGLAAPRTEEAAVAAQIGEYIPKAAWVLGVIGIPITKVWEPVIRYETRAFDTRAVPLRPVCVVARDAPEDATEACPGEIGDLKIVSGFETLMIGVRYDHSRTGSAVIEQTGGRVPPLTFGVAFMQYRKPYQLTVDGQTLDQYLFDGRFRGLGLAGGVEIGGGIDRLYGDLDLQLGAGEVSLTDSITINELVPPDQVIGYVQGNAILGYRWAFLHGPPTLILQPSIEIGGASFFLVDTKVTEDENGKTLPVNWDLLWTVQISLLIPL